MVLLGAGCARCGRPYGAGGVVVLAQRDEIAFVQLMCATCRTQTLALVTGIGAMSDEAQDTAEPAVISEDDVVEMRSFLAGYQGDLRTLLER
jgi:hypothetical protein